MKEAMEWQKGSPELGKLLDSALQGFACEKRMMFGSPAYMVNHNMFAGVHAENIFVRLSEQDRKDIVAAYSEAAPFEPVKGRVMKEYIVVPRSLYQNEKAFQQWLRRAHEYVAALPPKEQKRR